MTEIIWILIWIIAGVIALHVIEWKENINDEHFLMNRKKIRVKLFVADLFLAFLAFGLINERRIPFVVNTAGSFVIGMNGIGIVKGYVKNCINPNIKEKIEET